MLEAAQRTEPEIRVGNLPNAASSSRRNHQRYANKEGSPIVTGYVSEDVFSSGKSRVECADGNARAVRDIRYAYVLELLLAQQGNRRRDKVVEYILRSLLFGTGDNSWKPESGRDVVGTSLRENIRAARHCECPVTGAQRSPAIDPSIGEVPGRDFSMAIVGGRRD